ncbi:MAG: hypothetical protein Q4F35_04075 [Akkermansia sp.]|nr:hypothetical protein [Akkermansia sp.]
MWKYIIIGSVTLFLGASYLFTKNHDAMTAPGGEIAAIQTQFEQAIGKNKNIALDKTIKAYAECRTEWLQSQTAANEAKKAEIDGQIETVKSELEEVSREAEELTGRLDAIKNQKSEVFAKVAPIVDLDADSSTEEEVGDKVKQLMDDNVTLERKNAEEEAKIAALGAETERLNNGIAAARKLAQDRQARISPPDLKCSVLEADYNLGFYVLDAGIDKNVVIGSRLAVMRGEKKICELNVTTVESSRSSCDVVESTLIPGEQVEIGDTVVSVSAK